MNYQVMIEGQTIPLPEEIGKDDDSVKRALAPYYPEVANAMITRVTKDDVITITVIKRAGTKGNGLDDLIACRESKNPAIQLAEELDQMGELSALDLLELDGRIDQAIQAGEEQAGWVDQAGKRLTRSTAQPSPSVPWGF